MLGNSNNGYNTLARIDVSLQNARSQLHEIETKAEQASQRLALIGKEESSLYQELAKLKLDALDDPDRTMRELGNAERQALAVLAQREQAIARLVAETERCIQEQTQLEAERNTHAETIEKVAEDLHRKVSDTHTRLEADENYVTARDSAQLAVNQVVAASEKAERAEREHREKAVPFRQDPIFMYLWNRHYGTPEYRAGRVARVFDSWVADHIDFEAARRNYWMLLEIPVRLQAHVDALQADADSKTQQLEKLERAAETADGVVAIEEQLEDLRKELEAFDLRIEKLEQEYSDCLSQRNEFAAATDEYFQKAVGLMAKSYRSYTIHDLQREAHATAGYEDDSLVSQLAVTRQERDALEQEQRLNQQASQKLAGRLHELERIRRQFKQHRFDAPHSHFRNAGALAVSIEDFMQGLISGTELWHALARSQQFLRRRSYPNYHSLPGATRLPRGVRFPTNWGGGGGGFRLPRRGGGGGFRTGGGF